MRGVLGRRLAPLTSGMVVSLSLASCLPATSTGGGPGSRAAPPADSSADSLPVGFGSLRLEDVSLGLVAGPLRIRITPRDARLTRLTAPDTSERLASARVQIDGAGSVFLVAVETEVPGGADFDPLDLEIATRGMVRRASDIRGITSGWGAGRLAQRSPQQALSLFPDSVDPTSEWSARFGEVRNAGWAARRPRLEAERARVRARAGGAPQSSSSPNFLILR